MATAIIAQAEHESALIAGHPAQNQARGDLFSPKEQSLHDTQLSPISNFIWGVDDDYLRDIYVRGKYRT